MIKRLKSKTAVATVASLIAALGVGGVAVAQNSGSGNATPAQITKSAPSKANASEQANSQESTPGQENTSTETGTDTDNVQSGDQTGPDNGTSNESGSETSGEQSGSEVSGNDGPGGHADEPGNPNADHQFQGQE